MTKLLATQNKMKGYLRIFLAIIITSTLSYAIFLLINKITKDEETVFTPLSSEGVSFSDTDNQFYAFHDKLPYETEDYLISYPQYGKYKVYLFGTNTSQLKEEVLDWFKEQNQDLIMSDLNIEFITKNDEEELSEFYSQLPEITDNFAIELSPKTNRTVITIYAKDYEKYKKEAEAWIVSKGISTISTLNIL